MSLYIGLNRGWLYTLREAGRPPTFKQSLIYDMLLYS